MPTPALRTSRSTPKRTRVTMNHLMWNESIARQVGCPSQITDSLPIISMGAKIPALTGRSPSPEGGSVAV